MADKRNRIKKHLAGHYIFLTVLAVLIVVPFLWVIVTSLKTKDQFMMNPMGLPVPAHFENYAEAWRTINIPNLFKNSLLISSVSVAFSLALVSVASFVLARFTFKVNRWIYNFFLMGMMIPLNAAIIPLFLSIKDLGLSNTYLGVILPYASFQIPIGIFLVTNYMKTIPMDLEEAAVMDGCGILQLFGKIILPLSKPVFATFSIISFMGIWNDFLFALVMLTGEKYQTVPLGLAAFRGQYDTNTTVMLAATVICMIPTLVVYVILRDNIVKGMTAGAVKG